MILALVVALLLNAIVIFLTSYILPGIKLYSLSTALIMALCIGIINTLLHHILILMNIPSNSITMALTSLVVISLVVYVATFVILGFEIDSIWWGISYVVILTVFNVIIHRLVLLP